MTPPPKQEIKCPKKRNVEYIPKYQWESYQKSNDEGFNACHDQFMKVINENSKIHSCKCRNGEEGAMTVKRIDENLFQCPRCGGIIVGKPSLVALDICKVKTLLDTFQSCELATHTGTWNIANKLCSTFGAPSPTVLSVEEIANIIMKGWSYKCPGSIDWTTLCSTAATAIHQKLIGGK